MNAKEKVIKASWQICEICKDTLTSNIVNSVRAKKLDLNEDQVNLIVDLCKQSVDQGFHRSANVFSRVLNDALEDFAKSSEQAVSPKKGQ